MTPFRSLSLRVAGLALMLGLGAAHAAPDCKDAAATVNRDTGRQLDERQLADVLVSLNRSGRLPASFVTKREAREAGWRPGRSLWSVQALYGNSIGGDRFGNRERRLPIDAWREADLDYRGGKRNAKRLLFADSGRRFVTVDHYQTFREIPPCRR
ncbi:ribonuclease domain-containing protein [Crenobacter cavernae]|uniref:Ribonuclease n=1 Tax=Crenobacter cavernae TaxID=2290923 RepID=A0A345Y9Q5_9NEIS|nr:ribonuclease domain-containing protein [Crenobacter cavernae]AXK40657.1 ribonuclease [Crenobacter cavernae]